MRLHKKLAGLILVANLLLLSPLAAAAADLPATEPAVKLDLPDYLFTNIVNTITVDISGDADSYAGKYLGLYADGALLDEERLDAGSKPAYQHSWQVKGLSRHQIRVVLANDQDLTDIVSEDQQERTAVINGYAGNSSLLPFTSGEAAKGDFLITLGDSKYSGLIEPANPYTVHYAPTMPPGALVVQARLFASWTWSNWRKKGVEPQMLVSLDGQPLIPDRQYSDRKGWGLYDYPSGTWTYNVTKLITEDDSYTVVLKNTNAENVFAVNGIALLIIYEDAMSEKTPLKYWINEGCDIVWSSPISLCTPAEATTWTSFAQVPSPDQMTSATLLTLVPSGDKGKNALIFNHGVYFGLWDGKPYPDFAVNIQDVTRGIQGGDDEAGFQDLGNYMVPSAAVLLVRMKAGSGSGDSGAAGTVGPGKNGGDTGTGGLPGQGVQAGSNTVDVKGAVAQADGGAAQVRGNVLVKVGGDTISFSGSGSNGLAPADRLSAVLMPIAMLMALLVGFWTERTRLINYRKLD
jgi:hypothetical protein